MNEQENRERLAKAVTAARLRKFKTVDKARVAAGVARGTWEKVERGDKIKTFSLAAVEEALGWPEGRAQAILDGTDELHEQRPDLSRKDLLALREQIGSANLDPTVREQLLEVLARAEAG